MILCCVLFFFFKQKTAYEMRISDWSSDVCSSDLEPSALVAERRFLSLRTREICGLARPFARRGEIALSQGIGNVTGRRCLKDGRINRLHLLGCFGRRLRRIPRPGSRVLPDRIATLARATWRSEEHTSELQSLMRISYAVFCLKKKKTHKEIDKNYTILQYINHN